MTEFDTAAEIPFGLEAAVKEEAPDGPSYYFDCDNVGQRIMRYRYIPFQFQKDFHNCTATNRLLDGAMGGGKTRTNMEELTLKTIHIRGSHGMIYGASYDSIRDTCLPVLWEEVAGAPGEPTSLITDYNEQKKVMKWWNGSITHIRSADQPMKLKSFNLSFACIEEASEVTKWSFNMLKTRLRQKGPWRGIWLTTNPEGHDWVWEVFYDTPSREIEKKKDYRVFVARQCDNPTLPEDYKDLFKDMPKEMQARYVDASREDYVGNIYQIRRTHHVLPSDFISVKLPRHEWVRYIGIDWGHRNPCAVIFMASDLRGNMIVYDEIYEAGLLPSQIAMLIHKKLRAANMSAKDPDVKFIIDPETMQSEYNGKRVRDLFAEAGIQTRLGNNAVMPGILRTKTYLERTKNAATIYRKSYNMDGTLKPDEEAMILQKIPPQSSFGLFFLEGRCPKTMEEMGKYKWKQATKKALEQRDGKEEPRKKDDHCPDAIRYVIMTRPKTYAEKVFLRDSKGGVSMQDYWDAQSGVSREDRMNDFYGR